MQQNHCLVFLQPPQDVVRYIPSAKPYRHSLGQVAPPRKNLDYIEFLMPISITTAPLTNDLYHEDLSYLLKHDPNTCLLHRVQYDVIDNRPKITVSPELWPRLPIFRAAAAAAAEPTPDAEQGEYHAALCRISTLLDYRPVPDPMAAISARFAGTLSFTGPPSPWDDVIAAGAQRYPGHGVADADSSPDVERAPISFPISPSNSFSSLASSLASHPISVRASGPVPARVLSPIQARAQVPAFSSPDSERAPAAASQPPQRSVPGVAQRLCGGCGKTGAPTDIFP